MVKWFKRQVGLGRLRHGYCPLCRSSPPGVDCYVCYGSREYGGKLTEHYRLIWRNRFLNWLEHDLQ